MVDKPQNSSGKKVTFEQTSHLYGLKIRPGPTRSCDSITGDKDIVKSDTVKEPLKLELLCNSVIEVFVRCFTKSYTQNVL